MVTIVKFFFTKCNVALLFLFASASWIQFTFYESNTKFFGALRNSHSLRYSVVATVIKKKLAAIAYCEGENNNKTTISETRNMAETKKSNRAETRRAINLLFCSKSDLHTLLVCRNLYCYYIIHLN